MDNIDCYEKEEVRNRRRFCQAHSGEEAGGGGSSDQLRLDPDDEAYFKYWVLNIRPSKPSFLGNLLKNLLSSLLPQN